MDNTYGTTTPTTPATPTPFDSPSGNAPKAGDSGLHHKDVLGQVVQGAHNTVDRLAESAAPHVQRLQEGVNSASEMLHARTDQAREVGDEWAESLRTTVREHPLASLAAALAIGIVVAKLTS